MAAGAIYGGIGLLADPEGLGARRQWLEGSPFHDFTVPGIVLLVVIGGGMLVAAMCALADSHAAAGAAGMGCVLLVWGVVETLTLGLLGGAQLVLLALFVVLPGLCMLGLGGAALVRSREADDRVHRLSRGRRSSTRARSARPPRGCS